MLVRQGHARADVAPINAKTEVLRRHMAFPLVFRSKGRRTAVATETTREGPGVGGESVLVEGGHGLESRGAVRAGSLAWFGGGGQGRGLDGGNALGARATLGDPRRFSQGSRDRFGRSGGAFGE